MSTCISKTTCSSPGLQTSPMVASRVGEATARWLQTLQQASHNEQCIAHDVFALEDMCSCSPGAEMQLQQRHCPNELEMLSLP